MRKSSLHKRMYAVSKEGVGLIAGTMAYSRGAAIDLFTPHGNWEMYKREGYRTVMARVEVIRRWDGALSRPERATDASSPSPAERQTGDQRS